MNPLSGYLVWIKLGLVAILAAFLAFFAYKVRSWHQDALELGAVRQEMVELKASQAASQAASEGYQRELEDIRNRPVPSTPVRLCVKRTPVSPVGGGSGATLPASGLVQSGDGEDYQAGPDIAGELRALARKADEVTAQARATQSLHLPAK